MIYLEVLVGDPTYHGKEPLTYKSPVRLGKGQLVTVPLRHKDVIGVVVGSSPQPSFAVKAITTVHELPPLPAHLLSLLDWIRAYYPAPLGIITQLFLTNKLTTSSESAVALPSISIAGLPQLTTDQKKALTDIREPGLHLLHGETGSGKTRIYLELAKRSLEVGSSSIILTPEIGLTSQLSKDFRNVFGPRVIIVHSRLSTAARRKIWQSILRNPSPSIVIGPRSALFSPLQKLGFIAVDESHETAYKQDQAPYYHATKVAAKLAELSGATLVIGSATPSVADYYIAKAKHRPIVRMTQKATSTTAPETNIETVDMRRREEFTSNPYLSNRLIKAIQESLEAKEQTLLFLNRRGTARLVFCPACGWQANCPRCDLALTYHEDSHSVRCHTCGFVTTSPSSCPACQNTSIFFKGVGTKALVNDMAKFFPSARLMRFDNDNKKDERIEQNYGALHQGDVDIIIGTQTLAKGLDLPKLGLVGVINADTSLYFPDFSAQERTYQLISQVIGRIGRGHRSGRAIVQSYLPDNAVIQAALHNEWYKFYNDELKERRLFGFPPFMYCLKLGCWRATSAAAAQSAQKLAKELSGGPGLVVDGPYPSFYEKKNGKFGWQLVVRSKQRGHLVNVIAKLPSGWSYDIDPTNLL